MKREERRKREMQICTGKKKRSRNTHREIKIEKYRNRLKDRKTLRYADTAIETHTRREKVTVRRCKIQKERGRDLDTRT